MDFARTTDNELTDLSQHLRSLARRLVVDEASADDVVQEAWLAALEAPHQRVRDRDAWLKTVVRNLASRSGGRGRRRNEIEAEVARPEAFDDEALRERVATVRWLERSVRELDEPYRAVLHLRYFEELSIQAIGQRLSRPTPTVKTQLKRGLAVLRERVDSDPARTARWPALIVLAGGNGDAPIAVPGLSRSWRFHSAWVAGAALIGSIAWIAQVSWFGPTPPGGAVLTLESEAPAGQGSARTAGSSSAQGRPGGATRTPVPGIAALTPSAPSARAAPTAALRVRVVRFDGTPAPNATLVIKGSDKELYRGPVDSNARYVARINSKANTSIGIIALVPGEAQSPSYLVPIPFQGEVSVRSNGPEAVLVGRVTSVSGELLHDAMVSSVPHYKESTTDAAGVRSSPARGHDHTDEQGEYRLPGLISGASELRVSAPGYLMHIERVDLEPGEVRRDFELVPGVRVTGGVRRPDGTPVPGARVWASLPPKSKPVESVSDAEGRFELLGALPGTRYLNVSAPKNDGLGDQVRAVLVACEDFHWDATLRTLEELAVRVLDHDDRIVDDGRVAVFATVDGETWQAVAELDHEGRALFRHLPQEPLTVAVLTPQASAAGRVAAEREDVHPTGEELVFRLVNSAAREASLSGTLVMNDGRPIPDAHIQLYGDDRSTLLLRRLDADTGAFELPLLAGEWRAVVLCGELGFWDLGELTLHPGERMELGTLRAPPPAIFSLATAASGDLAGARLVGEAATLEAEIDGLPPGVAEEKLFAFDALPDRLELFPGDYRVTGEELELAFTVLP